MSRLESASNAVGLMVLLLILAAVAVACAIGWAVYAVVRSFWR